MADDGLDTATAADLSLEVSRRISLSHEAPEISGYELGEVLGKGAFGQVYKAVQKSTGQTVAVKVLFTVTEGFREEVARLSQVSDHPHVVTLVDANLDNEPPYLVTPYLPQSLQEFVPQSASEVDVEQVVVWFEQVAKALEFIHGRGILHCDLKPSNVLVGEDKQARLVDFGQSVALQGSDQRLGSFWFMPWQQAQLSGGEPELPQVSWDIHALGATAYVLLTGELPRATEQSRQSLSGLETSKEKIGKYRELVKASPLRPVRDWNPAVDADLAAIVERCLEPGEGAGYSSASDVVTDLWRRARKFPVRARPLNRGYWLDRFFARHRLSVSIATLALAVLITGFSWSSYQIYQARQARNALVVQQYKRGKTLLRRGEASGLVWLAEACRQDPRAEYTAFLRGELSKQLSIADPKLYRLRTFTAPSPSGTKGVRREPGPGSEWKMISLVDGTSRALPKEVAAVELDQKDTIRYRLDGVVLDPFQGGGGPATWRLPPFEAISPTNQVAILSLFISPQSVMHLERGEGGFRVYNARKELIFKAQAPEPSSVTPSFSNKGDLVVGWETGRVELYQREKGWKERLIDPGFRSALFSFSPNGDRLAAHDGESKIRVWNLEGDVLGEFDVGSPANDMAFSTDGKLLVCATRDALVHGLDLDTGQAAWSPAEMEKAARWVMVQPGGQIVTMSDVVIVWKPPESDEQLPDSLEDLTREVARRTGWVYDENARVRMLTRKEYSEL